MPRPLPSSLSASDNQPLQYEVIEQLGKFDRALVGPDLIVGEERIAQLLEASWVLQPLPNAGRDAVEAKALAGPSIQRDELISHVHFHQIDSAAIDIGDHELAPNHGPDSGGW